MEVIPVVSWILWPWKRKSIHQTLPRRYKDINFLLTGELVL
jgi:hypothetical protein